MWDLSSSEDDADDECAAAIDDVAHSVFCKGPSSQESSHKPPVQLHPSFVELAKLVGCEWWQGALLDSVHALRAKCQSRKLRAPYTTMHPCIGAGTDLLAFEVACSSAPDRCIRFYLFFGQWGMR